MPSMRMRTSALRDREAVSVEDLSNAVPADSELPVAPARRQRLLAALSLRHRVARPSLAAGPAFRPMKPAACPGSTARVTAAQQVSRCPIWSNRRPRHPRPGIVPAPLVSAHALACVAAGNSAACARWSAKAISRPPAHGAAAPPDRWLAAAICTRRRRSFVVLGRTCRLCDARRILPRRRAN